MEDEVNSQIKALRDAQQMGCSGAHIAHNGEWMPCASFGEYKSAVLRIEGKSRIATEEIVTWNSRRKKKGKKARKRFENLRERGVNGIQSTESGGMVSAPASGPIMTKSITGPYSPRDNDVDVFSDIESARARAKQIGCIGVSRRVSRNGKVVWMPCTNMTDYANASGTTALGRRHQQEQRNSVVRTVLRDISKQRKKSLAYELHEYKTLGRTLRNISPDPSVAFDSNAVDGDSDGVVQEGTPFKRPATPSINGLKSTGLNPADLTKNPQLDKSTLQLSKEMGFNTGDYEYDWTKHPSRSYDLKPNKPVTIAAARVDPIENAKKILAGDSYKANSGSYGLGAGFAFDGDDHLLNGWYEEYAHKGAKNRSVSLTANLNLEKPFVYSPKEDIVSEVKKNIGDENRIINLSKTALGKLGESNRDEKEKLQKIVSSGGKLNKSDFDSRVINLLARENGNDAMIRLSDDDGPDSTQILLLNLKKAKFTGMRETGTKQSEMGWLHSEIDSEPSVGSRKNDIDKNLEAITSALKAYHSLSEREKIERFGAPSDVIEHSKPRDREKIAKQFIPVGGLRSSSMPKVDNSNATQNNPYAELGGKTMGGLILGQVKAEHKNKPKRKMYFIGGTTGAGKGETVKHLQEIGIIPKDDEAAHIDPDFIKLGLPGYNDGKGASRVHETSRVATDHVIRDAQAGGMDTIIQGTGKRTEHLGMARRNGDSTVGHFVYAPTDIAEERQSARGKATGRDLPSYFPGLIAGEIPAYVSQMFERDLLDEFYLWDNSGDMTKGQKPKLIAQKTPGKPMIVHDREKFEAFAQSKRTADRWEKAANERDAEIKTTSSQAAD
jgi:hypothetical protein